MGELNGQMCQKLAFYAKEKKLSDMSAIEMVDMAFLKGEEAMILWKVFKRNCDNETLKVIAE
jgi:hypothetical protein